MAHDIGKVLFQKSLDDIPLSKEEDAFMKNRLESIKSKTWWRLFWYSWA